MAEDPAHCKHANNCELYEKFRLKGALKIWQIRYCNNASRYETCERFILSKQGKHVAPTLLPNGDSIPL